VLSQAEHNLYPKNLRLIAGWRDLDPAQCDIFWLGASAKWTAAFGGIGFLLGAAGKSWIDYFASGKRCQG
jgi:hypothetical protein